MLGWFHPDWTKDFDQADDVLVEFRAVDPDLAARAAAEIGALLAGGQSEGELPTLPLHPQSPDPRHGLRTRLCLEYVREQLRPCT
jgi:hypothetical protein